MDPLALSSALGARGVVLGVAAPRGRGDTEPGFLLLAKAADERAARENLAQLFDALERELGAPGFLDSPQKKVRGADYWRLDELFVARRGALVFVANDESFLRDALDLAAEDEASAGASLAAHASLSDVDERVTNDTALWGWIDVERLVQLDPTALFDLRRMNTDPGAQSLLGPGLCALGSAQTLFASVALSGDTLLLHVRGDSQSPAQALAPASAGTAARLAPSKGDVARAWVHRDYAALVAHRTELFAPEVAPVIARKLDELSLFFSGKDLGEEVLPRLGPWIQLVSRRIDYGPGREPELALPGLALIAELEEPEVTGADVTSAFQTLLGIMNLESAQQAQSMLRLELALEGDVQISLGRFPKPAPRMESTCATTSSLPARSSVADWFWARISTWSEGWFAS